VHSKESIYSSDERIYHTSLNLNESETSTILFYEKEVAEMGNQAYQKEEYRKNSLVSGQK
jgi:hypothetical protein